MDNEVTIIVSCVCCVIILASFLIGFSFQSLEANEVGLAYSENTLTIDSSTLYSNGVYFLGVGHRFIKYQKVIRDMDMQEDPITARTADGLTVLLYSRLLYRLNPDLKALHSLYLMFGEEGYEDAYYRVARSTIRDVASNYTAFQFWSEREVISLDMLTRLETPMREIFAIVDTFTLTNFQLPLDFENAIVETDVKREEFESVQFEQESAYVTAETNVLQAELEALTVANVAEAEASKILLDVDARIFTMNYTVRAEAEGYKQVKRALNMTEEELLQFVWLDSVSFWSPDSDKIFSVATPDYLQL